MKKFIITLPVLAAVLLAGCSKEMAEPVEVPEIETVKTVLRVGLVPEVKTYMGESEDAHRHVYWSSGDEIAVNGAVSDALAEVDPETAQAEFTFDGVLSAPYKIVYPASVYTDASHVTLPAVQKYAKDGFASGMFPMVAYSAEGSMDITLRSLCAILRVSVKRAVADPDTDNIVSVRFKGRNNEQVSGAFAVDYENAVLTGTSSAKEDKEVKVVKSLSTSTAEPCVYYLVVPAGTYSNGFDVVVKDASGHIMTKSKTASKTLEAGHQYDMAEFEFVPTATEIGIEISSAQQLVEFAEDYNNKKFEGGEPIVVGLTADIAFDATSSAAFNAAGGIGLKEGINVEPGETSGDNDYYFNGAFYGNKHTISGLTATVPLFVATGSAGLIDGLTINNSTFTFTHSNTIEGMFGSVVGYHKGKLEKVMVEADVILADVDEDVTQMTTLGGLVGRATTGTVDKCTFSGLISTPADFHSTGKLIIGGLVGRFSNAGSVTNSYFMGAISNEAQITSVDKSNPYLIIGGVAGFVDGGATVTSCTTSATHEDVATAYNNFNGKIVNKTSVAYHSAVGGIVGELNNGTVSSCTNEVSIAITIYKVGADGSRYMRTGGIVGKNNANGNVSDCTNNGTVQHRSNPKLQALGGIVGWNAGTVTACTNTAAVNQMTSGQSVKAGRVVSLGGVIGENQSGAKVSDVHNTANIEISSMEDGTASEVRMGGVIAYNMAAINGGNTKNITNTGRVYLSPNFSNQFLGYEMGGVVGLSTASVQNVKNSGYVYVRWNSDANVASKFCVGGVVGKMHGDGVIAGCVNEGGADNAGEVYLNVKAGSAGHMDNYIAGIVGHAGTKTESVDGADTIVPAAVSISDCSNSGYVHGGNTTKVNGKTLFAGGIVAYLIGESSIENCSNTGQINNVQSNNNYTIGSTVLAGGIAGHVEGTSEAPITIGGSIGCTVDATVQSTRGWVAGIAGYAKYVNISKCTVEQDINCAAHASGGLVGKAEYCSITNSSFKGNKIHSNNTQAGAGQGGLVANMNDTTVDGCSCYATILTNNVSIADVGAIVGISGDNNTIQNCHYKPTITTTAGSVSAQIAGSGTFTDGGGNVADL